MHSLNHVRALATAKLRVSLFALTLAACASAAVAQVSDPAVESICDTWGFQSKAAGLCNAYCEAMDCDADAPQASPTACSRVYARIMAALPPGTPFPSCADNDADGHPNGLDNCPNTANPGQEDANEDGEGDACEVAVRLNDLPRDSCTVGWGAPTIDAAWYGPGFNIAGVHYDQGLFAHADSDCRWTLDGSYGTLTASIGLDDGDGNCGAVEFKVYADGQLVYSSGTILAYTITPIEVDIDGATELRLVVDSVDGIACDESVWVDPILSN